MLQTRRLAVRMVRAVICSLAATCCSRAASSASFRVRSRSIAAVSCRARCSWKWADPTVIYSEGRTGLAMVDMWLTTVNPYRLTSPSRVYSPDFKRPRFTGWP